MSIFRVRPQVALVIMCLSNFAASVDVSIVNVALPTLSRGLNADNAELQWIVDGYSLAAAGLLLTAGNLGDRYGRRGLLTVGLAIFAVTSIVAANAESAQVLIAARTVMGLGAAIVYPTTLALVTTIFADPTKRARAIGVWSAMAGLGVIVGPIVGGWLLANFWFGSIFWINVPTAIVAMIGTNLFVPTSRDPVRLPLDFAGLALSAIGLTAFTYTIIEAPNVGWTSQQTSAGFFGSTVLLAAFVWQERRTPHPMVDTSIFAERRFATGNFAAAAAYLALCGFVFVMTQHLQFVTNYAPLETGVRLLPLAAFGAVASIFAPRFAERFGATAAVATGLAVFAGALALAATFDAHTPYWVMGSTMALLGIGLGATIAPATDSIMASLSPATVGVGSAVTGATRQLGATLGVAIIGSVFSSVYAQQLGTSSVLLDEGPPVHGLLRESMAEAEQVLGQLPATQAHNVRQVVESAFLDAFSVSCLLSAGLALAAAATVALVLPARNGNRAKAALSALQSEMATAKSRPTTG